MLPERGRFSFPRLSHRGLTCSCPSRLFGHVLELLEAGWRLLLIGISKQHIGEVAQVLRARPCD